MTKLEFLERAREKHGYKYNYPNLPDKVLSNDIIDIEYRGILYKQRVVKHINLGRCPEKTNIIKTTKQFIKEAKSVWGDKYDYSLVDYQGALKKVKIIYDGVVFDQVASSHLRYSPELNMNLDWFIKKSIEKWGSDRYDYSLVEYINCNTKVKIVYKKTGEVFDQTPHNHLSYAPEKIKLSTKKTNEQFIRESNIIHDCKYSYDKVEYCKNNINVIITCPIHGDFNQKPVLHIQGYGCPYCFESISGKVVRDFMDKRRISYYTQYFFSDMSDIPFDFYIPSIRTAIELYDIQHYQPIDYFGGLEAYERLRINDKIKNDYCEDNYINLIRIRWDQIDDIYTILWENLKNLIKL